jgi:hypothetical protein
MQSQGYEFQSEFARRHTAHGKAEAVLEARGLAVSAPERERILACTDLATLAQWVRRAVTAGSASELLG